MSSPGTSHRYCISMHFLPSLLPEFVLDAIQYRILVHTADDVMSKLPDQHRPEAVYHHTMEITKPCWKGGTTQ